MREYISIVTDIADRGANYALIVFGGLTALLALYDELWGNSALSSAQFIAVLAFAAALAATGGVLQFLTERDVRAGIAEARKETEDQALAAGDRLVKYMEIAKDINQQEAVRLRGEYQDTVQALSKTNVYGKRD